MYVIVNYEPSGQVQAIYGLFTNPTAAKGWAEQNLGEGDGSWWVTKHMYDADDVPANRITDQVAEELAWIHDTVLIETSKSGGEENYVTATFRNSDLDNLKEIHRLLKEGRYDDP